MPDVFTKPKRSEVMSQIRARGNKETEVALAKLMRRHGITGWRRQIILRVEGRESRITIRTDFIFPKQRVAVFVDGCFWHGCPKHSSPARWLRKSSMRERTEVRNQETGARRTGKLFWAQKLAANMARDRFVNRTLRRQGWRVLRIWEHELTNSAQQCIEKLESTLGRKTHHRQMSSSDFTTRRTVRASTRSTPGRNAYSSAMSVR